MRMRTSTITSPQSSKSFLKDKVRNSFISPHLIASQGAVPVYQAKVKLYQEPQGLYTVYYTAYEAKSYTVI